jgi:hypothetical protein
MSLWRYEKRGDRSTVRSSSSQHSRETIIIIINVQEIKMRIFFHKKRKEKRNRCVISYSGYEGV